MFQIIKLNDGKFVLKTKANAIHGDSNRIIRVMLELGIDSTEIEMGLSNLIYREDNIAEYGVMGRFIYSKRIS